MRRTFGVVAAAVLLAVPAAVMAQEGPAPTVTPRPARPPLQQSTTRPGNAPLFTLFGLPVRVAAPVGPPYCNCAYRDYAGEPMRSRTLVDSEANGMMP